MSCYWKMSNVVFLLLLFLNCQRKQFVCDISSTHFWLQDLHTFIKPINYINGVINCYVVLRILSTDLLSSCFYAYKVITIQLWIIRNKELNIFTINVDRKILCKLFVHIALNSSIEFISSKPIQIVFRRINNKIRIHHKLKKNV